MIVENSMLLMTRIPYVQAVSMSFLRSSGLLIDTAFSTGNLSSGAMPQCSNNWTLSKK
jgi:hypothetical protein